MSEDLNVIHDKIDELKARSEALIKMQKQKNKAFVGGFVLTVALLVIYFITKNELAGLWLALAYGCLGWCFCNFGYWISKNIFL